MISCGEYLEIFAARNPSVQYDPTQFPEKTDHFPFSSYILQDMTHSKCTCDSNIILNAGKQSENRSTENFTTTNLLTN